MATQSITIREDIYKLLQNLKKDERESFSDVIERTVRKRSGMDLAGAWKDISEKEIKEMKQAIADMRGQATKELLRDTE